MHAVFDAGSDDLAGDAMRRVVVCDRPICRRRLRPAGHRTARIGISQAIGTGHPRDRCREIRAVEPRIRLAIGDADGIEPALHARRS